jgi:16S rRNA (adenine1518-N6/adenine1519-N6)-dimethyltransferase
MIPAKKSLGQNFLKSKEALRALISAGEITSDDIVLEVGPGKGVLTAELLKLAKKVIAVEKDHRLIELLQEKFKTEIETRRLEVVEGDILEYRPDYIPAYKIIANIPYYITGTFLQKFLESEYQPTKMVIMLQKEVAQRIVARDDKESILSMSVKAYGNPKYVMTVKAKYFSPAPNVDSAIIAISDISKNFFIDFSEKEFFALMKLGFAHKRKMLVGNLSGTYSRERILEAFARATINEKARAEDISLHDWRKLLIELR